MPLAVDYLGFAAAACTTCAFVPQVLLVWRQRAAAGVSIGMYLILSVGVFLWLCYGLMLGAWPIVIANALTLLLVFSVLIMKWHFERWPPAIKSTS